VPDAVRKGRVDEGGALGDFGSFGLPDADLDAVDAPNLDAFGEGGEDGGRMIEIALDQGDVRVLCQSFGGEGGCVSRHCEDCKERRRRVGIQ